MNPAIARTLGLLLLTATVVRAQVPELISYQGRVAVGGVDFDGSGQFKFALVDADGASSCWSNDGTSTGGCEPVAAVTITVRKGLYSVLLGDASLPNMAVILARVIGNSDVFLRVWFNDGVNGSQQLKPDHRIATVAPVNTRNVRGGSPPAAASGWQRGADDMPPSARSHHTALWTGSEMLVWGGTGISGPLNSGARYRPADNTWTAINTAGAPSAPQDHTAVWTGREMIVWGSVGSNGGRYDPAADTWTAVTTAGAPSPRQDHTAVWTGSEMIVWGGIGNSSQLNDGGRYDPANDGWTPVSTTGAPGRRSDHTAVWTGSEMIVWGGFAAGHLNSGGRYHPGTDSWKAVATAGAPAGRYDHTAVWTGSEMIVWGGYYYFGGGITPVIVAFNGGARYHPASDTWVPVATTGAPSGRWSHTAAWTGREMIVWGGSGGTNDAGRNDGGRYDPAADSWTALSTTGAPASRRLHTALWTGSEMIVWGGIGGSVQLNDGGRYHPGADSWTAVTTNGAPSPRSQHGAVWTGNEMIVWGGYNGSSYLNNGGRYFPAADRWTALSTTGVPAARGSYTAVWTGNEMIIWGGYDGSSYFDTGGRYLPAEDSWTAVTTTDAPVGRSGHTAVWTGSEMIIWGGYRNGSGAFNDSSRYTPGPRVFRITSVGLSNGSLTLSFPTETGLTYTLWRSDTLADGSWINAGLAALAGTGATLSFTVPDPGAARRFFRVHAGP